MDKDFQADVVVVGAGTAGTYFAWQIAKAGFKVIILEARALDLMGQNIEVIHMDQSAFAEFGVPEPQPPERIHLETVGVMWSPDRAITDTVEHPFYVLNMPALYHRLHEYAAKGGVEIIEKAEVTGVIIENGTLCGVTGEIKGKPFQARARLVVDASGMVGAVRTKLPDGFGVENSPIDPAKIFCCCLELRTNLPKGSLTGSNSFMSESGFWNRSYGDDIIIGMSQHGGYEYTWQKHKEFRERNWGDPGKLVSRRQGMVPYRRSPFSLVGNGFLVVGDAAFQNRPFSGEGIISGWGACRSALPAALEALRRGDVSRKALWAYNTTYFHDQGAKFAADMAQLPAATEFNAKDTNYLFRHHIIFNGKDFAELAEKYEVVMGTGKLLKMVVVLIWGVITGQFKSSTLKILMTV
ncbi:MAG TPA: NAD(P)/FAD-dependent oxidoreductase, partial [Longilinea sp.]|nr:NAD(P)/FAD-dependent oxidoreductase [Longilinea sp.]